MIKVTIDDAGLLRMLENGPKQIIWAAKEALNNVAFDRARAGREYIRSKFDRPTRWTVNSWYVRRKATETKLEAVVGWSDYLGNKSFEAADYYLSQHWNGGRREYKVFEKRLIRAGIMPDGMNAVPGQAAEDLGMIDVNGNMKGSVLVAILSALSAFQEAGFNANATVRQSKRLSANKRAARNVYWAGKPGVNTPNGIWVIDEKHSKRGRLRPVIVFVRRPNYVRRLDMKVLTKPARSNLNAEFERAMRVAARKFAR